jgi:hypothetical protein
MLYHLLVIDIYDPVWPNIVASLMCFFGVLAKLRAMEKLRKLHHHQAMQQAQAHHEAVLATIQAPPSASP